MITSHGPLDSRPFKLSSVFTSSSARLYVAMITENFITVVYISDQQSQICTISVSAVQNLNDKPADNSCGDWPIFCIAPGIRHLKPELNVAAPKVKGTARYLIELRSILIEMSIETWIKVFI